MVPFRPYKDKDLIRNLIAILAIAGIMHATRGSGFVVVVPFVLVALVKKSADKMLFWMLIVTTMLISNPLLVPKSLLFGVTQRGLLCLIGLITLLGIVGRRISPVVRPFLGIVAYVGFMFIPSAFGWSPKVSYLKLVLFILIYFAYFGIANNAAMSNAMTQEKIRCIVLAMCIYFIFGSVALVPFPVYGQMRGEDFELYANLPSLFMGMTSHSQCLGPVVSAMAVFLLGDMLFSIRRPNKLYIALLACCPYLIYLTSSRTGMGAFLCGIGYLFFLFKQARGVALSWRRRVVSAFVWGGLLLVVVMCVTPGLNEKIARFALKWADDDKREKVSFDAIVKTRQGKFDECMYNFHKSPLVGNGFQVAPEMAEAANQTKGMILSAPVEKGFWIGAVLEEGGIIGFVLFTSFLLCALVALAKRRAYMTSASLFVTMMTNFGEFTFFSMTYIGGFVWSIVFASAAIDACRIRDEKKALQGQQMRPRWQWQWR